MSIQSGINRGLAIAGALGAKERSDRIHQGERRIAQLKGRASDYNQAYMEQVERARAAGLTEDAANISSEGSGRATESAAGLRSEFENSFDTLKEQASSAAEETTRPWDIYNSMGDIRNNLDTKIAEQEEIKKMQKAQEKVESKNLAESTQKMVKKGRFETVKSGENKTMPLVPSVIPQEARQASSRMKLAGAAGKRQKQINTHYAPVIEDDKKENK